MWADFHFIRPYCLFALLPTLVLLMLVMRSKLKQGNWSQVCDADLLPYLLHKKPVNQSRWPLASSGLAAVLAVFSLAGPTWERLPTPVFRSDSAMVIVLDMSSSMSASDIKPNRIGLARFKIADILKQRKDGQTALVVYGSDAFVVTPLTDDTDTIENQLSALNPEIMPSDGNNLAQALQKAEDLLKQAGLQKGQILLISDGGNIDEGLAKAKTLGAYQLLVLGAGTPDGAPVALPSGGFLKDDKGGIVIDKLDISGLEKLAQSAEGAYLNLNANDADIQALLANLFNPAQAQDGKDENLLLDQWNDKGPWLLLWVLPLAALGFRKGLIALTFCVLLPMPENSYAFEWQDLWRTKDQQAQEAYQKGDFNKAADLFENPNWKAAAQYKMGAFDKTLESLKANSSSDSLYNQGNALAQSGKLPEALEAYKNALKANPNDNDAKFNKDLVEKALEQQKQEQNQQNSKSDDKSQDDQNKNQNEKQAKQDENKTSPNQNSDSSKSENQNSQEQQEKDNKSEQNPEQSQENKSKQQAKQEEKAEPNNQKQKAEQAQKDTTKQQQQAEQQPDEKAAKAQESAQAQAIERMSAEEKQAAEQWLKRIPDDPAGLLRRKFKYQYDQSRQQ